MTDWTEYNIKDLLPVTKADEVMVMITPNKTIYLGKTRNRGAVTIFGIGMGKKSVKFIDNEGWIHSDSSIKFYTIIKLPPL